MHNIVDTYTEAFEQHGDSPCSVLWPKGRQRERFDALTRGIIGKPFSVLDFGCGLAHLKDYLANKYKDFDYSGVDIVQRFIDANQQKHPEVSFRKIDHYRNVVESYDYLLLSGVFNILYYDDIEQHKKQVQQTLAHLFDKTRIMLSVNFMTDKVDFVQPGAYHQNPVEILQFVTQSLSPRVLLDQSYMPYEYTLSVFKNSEIIRPDNLYPDS